MVPAPACSIIVPLFNKAELTRRCVRSVLRNTEPRTFELVLVDNGSSDETPDLCDELVAADDAGCITVIRNEVNQGFARACNQGARAARGEELVFLNNDTEVHAGWLGPLLAHLDDPTVGAVGSKLLFPDGTIQHAGVIITARQGDDGRFTPIHLLHRGPADHPLACSTRRFQVVTAACCLVRRTTFEQVGGFDEGYWNGYEDVDLCLQIGALGQRIVYEPASVVTHVESASGPERFRRTDANVERLMQRWKGRVTVDVIHADGTASVTPDGVLAGVDALLQGPPPGHDDAPEPTTAPGRREATAEALELRRRRLDLERARRGRDVCWLESDDEHDPLVTVRIATFDRGPLVAERAIASALAQTYENIEVLVVGDACDDATTAAVEAVGDERVRFVRLPTRGLYPADPRHRWMVAGAHPMVTALDLARGAWLAPCDDDDELTPDHVEVLLSAAKARRLEMVWSVARTETRPGTWTELGSEPLRHGHITHGSVLYSLGLRSFLPNARAWRLDEPGDWNLWRRMRDAGVRMGFVDHVTYVHYVETLHRGVRDPQPAGAAS